MIDLIRLLSRAARLWLWGPRSDPTPDYDRAAATYEAYYSRHLGRGADELLRRLPLRAGQRVADLACGTGWFTRPLAEAVGPSGRVLAVDLSAGMLDKNRGALARTPAHGQVDFVHADALAFLERLEPHSLDGVVCGWGLCYLDRARFRAAMERALRPGGFLGLIENRARTLRAVEGVFQRVMARHPTALVKHVALQLPKGRAELKRSLCRGRLREMQSWEGAVEIPCGDGRAIAEYMLRSGAAAGFLDALDPDRVGAVLADFEEEADRRRRRGGLPVVHEYCALLAVKQVA